MLSAVFLVLLAIFVISRVFKFFSGLEAVGHTPGFRCALSPFFELSMVLPTCFRHVFTNIGINFVWDFHLSNHSMKGLDIISVVPWLHGPPTLYVSSLELMRQVLKNTDNFDKQLYETGSELIGENVASVQKDRWKIHRSVVHPAFSQKLNALVWKESLRIYYEMISVEGMEENGTVIMPELNETTSKFTFGIILSCAFGLTSTWSDRKPTSEMDISLEECIKIVSANIALRLVAPNWIYVLPFKFLKRIDIGFNKIHDFMLSEIARRRGDLKNHEIIEDEDIGANYIFNKIVAANLEDGSFAFDEKQVIGNTFVMLFAGHGTASRTLAVALALLALHKDEQERVLSEIKQVFSGRSEPTLQDFDSFKCIHNVLHETMRLYPPIPLVVREAVQDSRLIITDTRTGERIRDMMIKKGTLACVNIVGIQRDPRYYTDPEAFQPSRWNDGAHESDAFLGFGHGPRTCIGRKFSFTQMTCFLAMLLHDWQVHVDFQDGETGEQWQHRVLTVQMHAAHGLGPIPVRFTRREC